MIFIDKLKAKIYPFTHEKNDMILRVNHTAPLKKSFLYFFLCSLLSFACRIGLTAPLVIHGKVVHPEGYYQLEYVVIEEGVIQAIEKRMPDLPEDTPFIYTKGYIFPGLIDLHTHLTYNILPLWENARGQFSNRFEWRDDPHYQETVRPAYRSLSSKETDPEFYKGLILFDELQAVAGGTTLIQESRDIDKEANEFTQKMVVRGTDYAQDLDLDNGKQILSVIDLFEYRKTMPPKPKKVLDRFAALREKDEIQAFIPHLAEGRTGFLRDHSYDEYSREEFEAFMNHSLFSDPDNAPKPPIGLIHSSGIDPYDTEHIHFLKTWNMGIIWSPVSNLLLYGDTLDVETLIHQGILIALGSDWSPSGSKHVLDEARLAKFYLNTIGADIADEDIFQMMTLNAAAMIGHPKLGALEEGFLADLFILDDSSSPQLDAMEALFNADVKHISLVIIDGKAVYGDKKIMELLEDSVQPLPEREREDSLIAQKMVYIDPQIDLVINDVIERIEDHLKEFFDMKRSNTLSSTDVAYQERMDILREFISETFSK